MQLWRNPSRIPVQSHTAAAGVPLGHAPLDTKFSSGVTNVPIREGRGNPRSRREPTAPDRR
jgi:hypothetical protein